MGRRSKQTFLQRRYTDGQKAHAKMLNITSYQGNANQNYNEVSPHNGQSGQRQKSTDNAGEDVGKTEPYYTVDGNVNWYSHYGKV